MMDDQLPVIMAIHTSKLSAAALVWLGVRGYAYESGPSLEGRVIFVRQALQPWEMPQPEAASQQQEAKEG